MNFIYLVALKYNYITLLWGSKNSLVRQSLIFDSSTWLKKTKSKQIEAWLSEWTNTNKNITNYELWYKNELSRGSF